MYVTNAYRMDESEALDWADAIGMGQLVSYDPEDGLEATLLPFVLKRHDDGRVTLEAHFARVNRQWEQRDVMMIVQGPTTYVSGADQPAEADDARVPTVPSIDYVAVHLRGRMTHRQGDVQFTVNHLKELVEKFDAEWRVGTHSDPRLVLDILPALVAVEIEVTEVIGKWKLHQGLPPEGIAHTASKLRERNTPDAQAVAKLMEEMAIPWAQERAKRMQHHATLPVPKPSTPRPPHVYKYERRAAAQEHAQEYAEPHAEEVASQTTPPAAENTADHDIGDGKF